MSIRQLALISAVTFPVLACADSTATVMRGDDVHAVRSSAREDECVRPADAVIATESELSQALLTAHEGDVIAISGMIALTREVRITVSGVTLTCAALSDGLTATSNPLGGRLIAVVAPDVTVQGLTLDGSRVTGQPLLANTSSLTNGNNARFVANRVRCGAGGCVFNIGAAGLIVTDNHFESSNSNTGIHLQRNVRPGGDLQVDGARIERNVIIAVNPQGDPRFGAIRVRDGRDIVIRDNTILGPWSNGIALTEVRASTVDHNDIDGAAQYGLLLGVDPATNVSVVELLVRSNAFSTTGAHALFVDGACDNTLVGNRLSVEDGDVLAIFGAQTGNNKLLGPTRGSVDNGAIDCNGDGAPDPNFLSGAEK